LVGDLYLLRERRTVENELLLLGAAIEALFGTVGVERIESQLRLLGSPGQAPLPFPEHLTAHPRNFMTFDMTLVPGLRPGRSASKALIDNWGLNRDEDAAQVIAQAVDGAAVDCTIIKTELLDALRADAERYRAIVNRCTVVVPPEWMPMTSEGILPCRSLIGDEIDAAIDKARSAISALPESSG
jgi:hypothetical protein